MKTFSFRLIYFLAFSTAYLFWKGLLHRNRYLDEAPRSSISLQYSRALQEVSSHVDWEKLRLCYLERKALDRLQERRRLQRQRRRRKHGWKPQDPEMKGKTIQEITTNVLEQSKSAIPNLPKRQIDPTTSPPVSNLSTLSHLEDYAGSQADYDANYKYSRQGEDDNLLGMDHEGFISGVPEATDDLFDGDSGSVTVLNATSAASYSNLTGVQLSDALDNVTDVTFNQSTSNWTDVNMNLTDSNFTIQNTTKPPLPESPMVADMQTYTTEPSRSPAPFTIVLSPIVSPTRNPTYAGQPDAAGVAPDLDNDEFVGVPIPMYTYKEGENCENPLGVPCAPTSLKDLCDRRTGNFADCLQACIPSFCCTHDAPPETNYLAPSCKQDPNCAAYAYCYVVWWKLSDTIGPANHLTLKSSGEFFNVNSSYFEDEHPVFFLELLFHHFEDPEKIFKAGFNLTGSEPRFDPDLVFSDPDYWNAESVLDGEM
jgi:hypothetical protein